MALGLLCDFAFAEGSRFGLYPRRETSKQKGVIHVSKLRYFAVGLACSSALTAGIAMVGCTSGEDVDRASTDGGSGAGGSGATGTGGTGGVGMGGTGGGAGGSTGGSSGSGGGSGSAGAGGSKAACGTKATASGTSAKIADFETMTYDAAKNEFNTYTFETTSILGGAYLYADEGNADAGVAAATKTATF